MFVSYNPYLNKQVETFPLLSNDDLDKILFQSVQAQQIWQQTDILKRIEPIARLGNLLTANADELAVTAAEEIGKPIQQAKAEVLKCATVCNYYANNAPDLIAAETVQTEKGKVMLMHEPLGVVLGIFPWNFPYWQIIRSAVPVLAAGNSILVKPAPNMPRCALALQKLIDKSGFLQHVYATVMIDENQIATLITSDQISGVTFTGSDATGSKVAEMAGKNIKKFVLELGGSDPMIIFNDADLDTHLPEMVLARLQNNGQSCVAAKRFLVQQDIIEKFTEKLIQYLHNNLKSGNPLLADVNIGPLARVDLCQKLTHQVEQTLKAGAEVVWQMQLNESSPCFFAPVVLKNISAHTPAAKEELFGPVFGLFTFTDTDEAIAIANSTPYGLGASVFTNNEDLAVHVAKSIKCGMVSINKMVKSDTRFPFGGIKKSGIGKELGPQGLKEFTHVKTIFLNQTD